MSRSLAYVALAGMLMPLTGFSQEKPGETPSFVEPAKALESDTWHSKAAHLDHLRRAVEHLEAAGLSDLAAKVEEQAETEVLHAELAQKRNELQKITEDIKRLERLLDHGEALSRGSLRKQVMTRIKVLEVDLSKLDDLGLKLGEDGLGGVLFNDPIENGDNKLKQRLLHDKSLLKLLDWLSENGFSKVVAEPVLASMSGKPASFFSGGQVPVVVRNGEDYAVAYRNVGTQLDLLPIVLEGGKLRLEIRPTLSRVVPASYAKKLDGNEPDYESRSFDTAIELRSGQTVAIGGLTTTSNSKSAKPKLTSKEKELDSKGNSSARGTEYIFLITPEIVEPKGPNVLPGLVEPTSVPRALPQPSNR